MKIGNYQLTRREEILLVLAGAILSLFFCYRVVWGQQIPAYRQLRARLQAGQERLVTLQGQAAAAPELARQAEQVRADWEATRLRLGFTLRGTAAFLAAAQPRDSGLQVLAFRPSAAIKKGSFQVYPYEVAVSGSYPALVAYLAQLESLPAPVVIHNLKITSRPGPGVKVDAGFTIELYDPGWAAAVPAAVALFPTGRADSFAPPPGVAAAGPGSQPAPGATPGGGSGNGSEAVATGQQPAVPTGSPATGPAGPQVQPGAAAGNRENTSPNPAPTGNGGTGAAPPAPAGGQETPPPLAVPPPETTDTPPTYTLPFLEHGQLVSGPAFREPPAGDGDVWLDELRVLRNVGPFFVLDRPAALAGWSLGRSIGVNLNHQQARAEVSFDLGGRYTRLQGYAGIDDTTCNSTSTAGLTVAADGRQLAREDLQPGDFPRYLDLPLFQVHRLTFSLEWQAGGIGDYDQLLAALASLHFSRRY